MAVGHWAVRHGEDVDRDTHTTLGFKTAQTGAVAASVRRVSRTEEGEGRKREFAAGLL